MAISPVSVIDLRAAGYSRLQTGYTRWGKSKIWKVVEVRHCFKTHFKDVFSDTHVLIAHYGIVFSLLLS